MLSFMTDYLRFYSTTVWKTSDKKQTPLCTHRTPGPSRRVAVSKGSGGKAGRKQQEGKRNNTFLPMLPTSAWLKPWNLFRAAQPFPLTAGPPCSGEHSPCSLKGSTQRFWGVERARQGGGTGPDTHQDSRRAGPTAPSHLHVNSTALALSR